MPPFPRASMLTGLKIGAGDGVHIVTYNIDPRGEGDGQGCSHIEYYMENSNLRTKTANFPRIPNEFCRPVSELSKFRLE